MLLSRGIILGIVLCCLRLKTKMLKLLKVIVSCDLTSVSFHPLTLVIISLIVSTRSIQFILYRSFIILGITSRTATKKF